MRFGSGTATRRIGATATAILLLMMALATPVLGGGPICSLQATVGGGSATEVETGEAVLIEGFGFPATVDVDLVYDVDGTVIGGETVTTDARVSAAECVDGNAGRAERAEPRDPRRHRGALRSHLALPSEAGTPRALTHLVQGTHGGR